MIVKRIKRTHFGLFAFFYAFFGLFSPNLLANPSGSEHLKNKLRTGYFSFQAGGYWSSQGQEQQIEINGMAGDLFTLSKNNSSNGLVGASYLFDGQEYDRFKMSYGVNGFYLAKTRISGSVFQELLYENLTYAFNVTHYPVYAMAKADVNTAFAGRIVTLDVGIGPNFMRTNNFTEKGISISGWTTEANELFSNKTTTTFSATAGIGLKFNRVFGEKPLECGYRFFYLGQGGLNVINDQVKNSLQSGTVYANAVMCAIAI